MGLLEVAQEKKQKMQNKKELEEKPKGLLEKASYRKHN